MAIELGRRAGTSLDKSVLTPAEDARRKRALEIMSMPKRYSSDARIQRVARVAGNQVEWMARYLRTRPRASCLAITQHGTPCRSMMPNPRACSSTPLLAYMNFLVDFLFGPFGMIGTMGQVAGAAHSPSA